MSSPASEPCDPDRMVDRDDIPPPEHRDSEHRLVVTMDGYEAELVYDRRPQQLVLVHTGVPDELEGKGVGAVLVRAAVDLAVSERLVVVPRCPFARRWLKRHPEVAELVPIEWPPLGARSHP
jgi:predicted GNAT family acetyltransferase